MFKKTLATLGVGTAKVDTRLEKSTFIQGELVKGQVYVQGGKIEQQIDEIYLYLVVEYEHGGKQQEHVVGEFRITEAFTIEPKAEKRFPFEFQLPYDAPIAITGAPLYLKTGLDIKMARDPQDLDGIEILPHPSIDVILAAVEEIGFRHVQVVYDFEHFYSRYPFVQVYQCIPVGELETKLDTISFVFFPNEKEVDVIMQLDKRGNDILSSVQEAFKLDEKLCRFLISQEEIEQGVCADRIMQELQKQL